MQSQTEAKREQEATCEAQDIVFTNWRNQKINIHFRPHKRTDKGGIIEINIDGERLADLGLDTDYLGIHSHGIREITVFHNNNYEIKEKGSDKTFYTDYTLKR